MPNIHASAVVLGDRGLLIMGASGAGKTTLALALVSSLRASDVHAALIADDQLLVENIDGALLVHAPDAIAGLAEIYGLGPRRVDYRRTARIDAVARLVERDQAPRMQDATEIEIAGLRLPALTLPVRQAQTALPALQSWLGLPPFAP